MPVSHLYIFFGKLSIQVFCPFFDWVVCCCFFILSCMSCSYILDINPLLVIQFATIPQVCLFVLLMVSSAVQKLLSLIRSRSFTYVIHQQIFIEQIPKASSTVLGAEYAALRQAQFLDHMFLISHGKLQLMACFCMAHVLRMFILFYYFTFLKDKKRKRICNRDLTWHTKTKIFTIRPFKKMSADL